MMIITGRTNEIINRGGTKVSPDAIEEIIKKHPEVEDVAVVGMTDAIGIEQIWVAIVSRGGGSLEVDKMYDYVREAAPVFLPDRIFPIAEIPRNRLGKVSRERLKETLKVMEDNHTLTIR